MNNNNNNINKQYFIQEAPHLGNQYLEDTVLVNALHKLIPLNILNQFENDLIRFGDRVIGDILIWGRESENNPPTLTQFDAWGNRIDHINVSNGWKQLEKIAAEEGLISIAYERKYGEWSRVYQLIKLYLFAPSSAIFGCPLAMTDGAARLIELWGDVKDKQTIFQHLISRDPKQFWTSGQWMTEKTGGSDVGNSETIAQAINNEKKKYLISGTKFFTSATTSNITLMLARIIDDQGNYIEGSKGLSVFLVELRDLKTGKLNNIIVNKLKNKMGTKAVPTAEIELQKTPGKLIGPKNKGIQVISTILNITRIENALHSVSLMRRGIAIARDYAHRRKVFDKFLSEQPLHLTTLAELEIKYRGCLYLFLEVIILLGKNECNKSTNEENILLRLLTPLVKLYTAKVSIEVTSETIEMLGGTGYMEDSDMPRLLRDSQVTSIWEGTTNVLSLDVWRPIRSEGALDIYIQKIQKKIDLVNKLNNQKLKECVSIINKNLEIIHQFAMKFIGSVDFQFIESTARMWSFSLARTYIASLLVEHSINIQDNDEITVNNNNYEVETAWRWCTSQTLVNLVYADENYRIKTKNIALDIDDITNQPRGMGSLMPNGKPRCRY